MSRVAQLLAAKRKAQIAAMTGEETSIEEVVVDRALRSIRPPRVAHCKVESTGLRFTSHAWKRMNQRRMTPRLVYAIWRCGEPVRSWKHVAYRVTRRALGEASPRDQAALATHVGAVIIVDHEHVPGERPTLVTVIADGDGTSIHENRTANDNRRWHAEHRSFGVLLEDIEDA